MSDLYGTDDRSPFEPDSEAGGPPEPEDMNIFLHHLLHNSPATVAATENGRSSSLYRGSGSMINSFSGASFNFSDPSGFFGVEAKERVEKTYSLAAVGDCDAVTSSMNRGELSNANKVKIEGSDFNCEGLEASDIATNQAQLRSSKRSRSAEVHNLSEKRRRSRINEKLKALQNLIPNSNKTDKASMLDAAIEYLKQLQQQVQMLTIRNGLSFHPNYVSGGSLPPMQLPVDFNEGNVMPNTSRGADTLLSNQEVVLQTAFGIPIPKISSQQLAIPPMTTNSSSAFSFGLQSPIKNNHGVLNHLASAKVYLSEN